MHVWGHLAASATPEGCPNPGDRYPSVSDMSQTTTDLPLPLKTLVEVAELLRQRRITSVELTKATLAHIARHEPRLHAYIFQFNW